MTQTSPPHRLQAYFTDFYDFFTRYVECDPSQLTLLDFGCGRDGYVSLYSEYFDRCLGLDILDYASCYNEKIEFIQSNGRDIPLADRSVDVVVAHSVLEHVEDIEFTLSEVNRVLIEGGYAYLTVSPLYYSQGGGHLRLSREAERLSDWEHLDPDSSHYLGIDDAHVFINRHHRLNKLTTAKFLGAVGKQTWDIVTYKIAARANKPLPQFLRATNLSRLDLYTKEFRLIARKGFSIVGDEILLEGRRLNPGS
jgi:SAM-dependent methyltransferase